MSLWIKSKPMTIQMKATEQYLLVVLLIMLYKVVLTFESVDEILLTSLVQQIYLKYLQITPALF